MTDLIKKVDVPEGKRGIWRIERFKVDAAGARANNIIARRDAAMTKKPARVIVPGTYTRLWHNNEIMMSDTPAEMAEHSTFVQRACGRCLIFGLGLGMVAGACLDKPEVEHVMVVELAPEVIELVAPHYLQRYGSRLNIIQGDAFTWEPLANAHYDNVWIDIWPDLSADNLTEMYQLRQRYRQYADWLACWGYSYCVQMAQVERKTLEHPAALVKRTK